MILDSSAIVAILFQEPGYEAVLEKLVTAVEEEGTPIILCRNGKPVADLVPHRKRKFNMTPHPDLKGAKFLGDPCAPLPEDVWPEELR